MNLTKNKPELNIQDLLEKLIVGLKKLRRYSVVIFLIFIALLYGFVLLRINSLSNTQPSPDAVSSQVQAAQTPHIDESVVKQLQSLQDNSVSVQALFNQARSNPFQ
ncbi:MAG TPA: hypothetical protein VK712_04250 [Verrucomicrobiae bacterium]|jgi:hypothetical protein|nr:hypothetical protein [Verrucomicrobiae bacterium]